MSEQAVDYTAGETPPEPITLATIQDVIEHGYFDERGAFRLKTGEYIIPEHIKLPSPIEIGYEGKGEGGFAFGYPVTRSWHGVGPSSLSEGQVTVDADGNGHATPDQAAWRRRLFDMLHCRCCARRAAGEDMIRLTGDD